MPGLSSTAPAPLASGIALPRGMSASRGGTGMGRLRNIRPKLPSKSGDRGTAISPLGSALPWWLRPSSARPLWPTSSTVSGIAGPPFDWLDRAGAPWQDRVVAPVPPAPANAQTQGAWQLLPFHSGVLAIHTAVLHTGKVLFFAGSGNSHTRFQSPLFGDEAHHIWTSAVWDPSAGAGGFFHPHTRRNPAGRVIDFFCCGHTFL